MPKTSMSKNNSMVITNCSAYTGRPGRSPALKMQGESGSRFQSSGLKEQCWSQTGAQACRAGRRAVVFRGRPAQWGSLGRFVEETVSKPGHVLSNTRNEAEKDIVQRIQGRNEHILAQEPQVIQDYSRPYYIL